MTQGSDDLAPDALPPGLYEALVTEALDRRLRALPASATAHTEPLDPGDAHVALARHLHHLLTRALRGRPDEQAALHQRVLAVLRDARRAPDDGDALALPARQLLAITEARPLAPSAPPDRPTTVLSGSALLTNAHGEPSIGAELRRELASADRVDVILAFVRWYGLRTLESALVAHLRDRGRPLRLLTTTYMGVTERRALDRLHELGAEIRVAMDERDTTRLHAKAWLFHRASGYSTAYVGSSNMSRSALLDGLEWNVRLSNTEAPHLLDKFRATFDSYWLSEAFQPYDPARDAPRLDRALARHQPAPTLSFVHLDVEPRPHQREILDALRLERERHGRTRNLVVAATGTGKTVVAALDYRRLVQAHGDLKLLFVAHRKELLLQTLHTFRAVLRDGAFGELFVAGARPDAWRHVFASVQSLDALGPDDLPPAHFDMVIVDEFHHAAAPTYRRLLDRLQPRYLLGLTATPERADGQSVLPFFGDRIAAELRLWEALDRQLLCPFQYFGLSDNTDLRHVSWRRGGYAAEDLTNLYTGDHARVALVLAALRAKLPDVHQMRAIGFCVSVDHARFMAAQFTAAGLPSLAVSADTPAAERDAALTRLARRDLNALFAVDLYNEGVDVPQVDTLLFLRPTESATVFLQQLGRGLRFSDGKTCCTVLDFIGRQRKEFRFDLRYAALSGASRRALTEVIEHGFPYLPAGCHFELDPVARETILAHIKASLPTTTRRFADELRAVAQRLGPTVTLADFLRETLLEPEDLYRSRGWSWTTVRREAGLPTPPPGPDEAPLLRSLATLLHVDDPERCQTYRRVLAAPAPPDLSALSERDRRLLAMLHFGLRGSRDAWPSLQASLDDLWRHPAVLAELTQLLDVLDARSQAPHQPLPLSPAPLHVHGRYTRDEIIAAFARLDPTRPTPPREGVFYDPGTRTDLFFITLHKTERHFSPTTRYEDYPLTPELFHWQSQSTTTPDSPTGRRYLTHRDTGSHILLFVRDAKKDPRKLTAPYLFLGPADLVDHQGSRPISITWRLRTPMPLPAFEAAKVVAG